MTQEFNEYKGWCIIFSGHPFFRPSFFQAILYLGHRLLLILAYQTLLFRSGQPSFLIRLAHHISLSPCLQAIQEDLVKGFAHSLKSRVEIQQDKVSLHITEYTDCQSIRGLEQ